ncbi:MAG: hypothetical protein P1U37_05485 [Minwuia sp.]|nr:hypothetical protein [Minwuia sp.]
MPAEHQIDRQFSISEGANDRLNLASLRVGVKIGEGAQREIQAQLTVTPQTVTANQRIENGNQEIRLVIALRRLSVLLQLEGGEFDFGPGYSVLVDPEIFNTQEAHQTERSTEGQVKGTVNLTTPKNQIVTAEVGTGGSLRSSNTHTQKETRTHRRYLVSRDTPPPDANPDQVMRWQIGADGTGGDPETGLPYLNSDTYLNRNGRSLATFHALRGGNRIAVNVALAMLRDDLFVNCVDEAGIVDDDILTVKAKLAQMAITRAFNKYEHSKIEAAMKPSEILIDMKQKETVV